MKKKTNFNGAIGAWMTSELHPSGATLSSPNSNFSSVKLKGIYATLDYLSIGWFGIDMSNLQPPPFQTSNNYLAKAPNMVFVSTHDIELAVLLHSEYELFHFSEKVENATIDFDYKLKEGKLKNRNAIRILEVNAYPESIIEEANALARNFDETVTLGNVPDVKKQNASAKD